MKEKIIRLRKEGKSYRDIENELGCSRATISYHCKRNDLNDRVDNAKSVSGDKEFIIKLQNFYQDNTIDETAKEFGVSKSTVKRYVKNKRIETTKEEKRKKNYNRVKSFRQKTKEKAIEYKGGKCEKCGYNKCSWAFEFHHLDSEEKDFGISSYATLAWDKIKKELDKCVMVCANCHRELHYEEYINSPVV